MIRGYLAFLRTMWRLQRQRWKLVLLVPAMFTTSVMEMLGIAAILPIIHLLIQSPETAGDGFAMRLLEPIPEAYRLQICCAILLGIFVLKGVVSVLVSFSVQRVALGMRFDLSDRLLGVYLGLDYRAFKDHNVPTMLRNVWNNLQGVISGMVIPTLEMLTETFVVVAMFGLLMAVEPLLTLIITICVLVLYGAVFLITRKQLTRRGAESTEAIKQYMRILLAGLNGFKEVRLWGMAATLRKEARRESTAILRNEVYQGTVSRLPRYSLEVVAIGFICLTILYYQAFRGSVADAVPFLALLAMATMRLAPSIHKIYGALVLINFYKDNYDEIRDELVELGRLPSEAPDDLPVPVVPPMSLREIDLVDVGFRYAPDNTILDGISLHLEAGHAYGFVGFSGAGKTTLIELLLGLLKPSTGSLLVDGAPLTDERLPGYYCNIGYVPQDPYIAEGTLMDNLAFGVRPEDRSEDRAWEVLAITQLTEVVRDLPQGLHTPIQERATRLSGGQRQRLAIARALYRDPQVLVLDEATSALDSQTEAALIRALRVHGDDRIILSIAHRVTTLKDADTIHVMNEGRIVAHGSYDELSDSSDEFRRLAALDDGEPLPSETP